MLLNSVNVRNPDMAAILYFWFDLTLANIEHM